MLYISGYIKCCLNNTFGSISQFFIKLNSCIIPEEKEVLPRYNNNYYNFSKLSPLEEVVVYEQPRYRRSKSDPNLKLQNKEKETKFKNSEWDIL